MTAVNSLMCVTQVPDSYGRDIWKGAYLQELAKLYTNPTEHQIKCRVGSFVTDNVSNMRKMSHNLAGDSDVDVIVYGCSMHYLNLISKDVERSRE